MLFKDLRQKMVQTFVSGTGTFDNRTLFYALRWDLKLRSEELRHSCASLMGHIRRERERTKESRGLRVAYLECACAEGASLSIDGRRVCTSSRRTADPSTWRRGDGEDRGS